MVVTLGLLMTGGQKVIRTRKFGMEVTVAKSQSPKKKKKKVYIPLRFV